VPGLHSEDSEQSVEHPKGGGLAPFLAVAKQPRLLLLLGGFNASIGLAIGWASSSVLYGVAAFAIATLAPVLISIRLAGPGR
jgi:hypothetical protein